MRKISLTDALVELCRFSVPEAKGVVDDVLANRPVEVAIRSGVPLESAVENLEELGAILALQPRHEQRY
jgi:hypothetical protein